MPVRRTSLRIHFRRQNSQFGVTRATLNAMADRLDISESEVVHLALSRLATDELPTYEPDDAPLSVRELRALKVIADAALPVGNIVKTRSLF